MATIKGSSGADVYELRSNDLYDALEGDDRITIFARFGAVQGGPGNDTIVANPSLLANNTQVHYWSSPGVIEVDLENGFALDGFGTRDTLVNIFNVHGFKQPGDKGFGTSKNDSFYIIPNKGILNGTIVIDGRGGDDRVDLYVDENPDRGELVIIVSADGRLTRCFFKAVQTFVFEFRDVERLNYLVGTSGTEIDLIARISFDTSGEDILLRGAAGWQIQGPGIPLTVTYSFLTERPQEGADGGAGFAAFSPAQQVAVRELFSKLQEQTMITFREVSGTAGDIRFGINQQSQTRGYSFVPDLHRGQPQAGDVWLDVESAALMNPGQEGYYALLHEVGHALGLQHPLTANEFGEAVVLLDQFASLSNTVMIDRTAADTSGLWPRWFGTVDMQALRFLYGMKPTSTGSNHYNAADLSTRGYSIIVDDGGEDTFDASGLALGATIDLRPGWPSSIGANSSGEPWRNNLCFAVGTEIEFAIGTSYDDAISGSEGPNRLAGNGGSDYIDGNGGLDFAIFKGPRSAWTVQIAASGASWFVHSGVGGSGMAEVVRIERIRFDDLVVALDLKKTDSAGKAILLVSAVLGKETALTKSGLLGQVIDLFDQGFTLEQLAGAVMRLPIWGGVLTPSNSSEDIARYLLRLNKGTEPTNAEIISGARALAEQTQGSFLASLALSEANVSAVDLVGLARSGFDYPTVG